MNIPPVNTDAGLVAHWDFDDGTATNLALTTIDSTLNATTATPIASTYFDVAGLAFGYGVLLPFVVRYLLTVAEDFQYAVTVREYLRFALRMLVAMGISAQLPLMSFVLARFGLVTAGRLLRWLPYAVLAAFVLAAVITPPDGISQVLVAVPMLVLYLFGVLVAALATPRRA